MPSKAFAIADGLRAARLLRSRAASARSCSAVRSSRISSARPVSPPSPCLGRRNHGSARAGIPHRVRAFARRYQGHLGLRHGPPRAPGLPARHHRCDRGRRI